MARTRTLFYSVSLPSTVIHGVIELKIFGAQNMNHLCRQCVYVYELTAEYPVPGQLPVLLHENREHVPAGLVAATGLAFT